MSDQQIRDEAMTIFLAGHETTANAMAWTWHLLSGAPAVERRLHEEIDRVLEGRTPTVEDVPKLEYTRGVIAESMRLFSPAWTMGRRVVERHNIGGFDIEPNALVLASQWVVHRDPRWWTAPEEFKPERWLTGPEHFAVAAALGASQRPKYAYFPFGGGSRVCIGESFAWTELILLLATIAQRWRFLPSAKPPVPEPRITLRPKGLLMQPQRRG
jgi:cytochrome P450